MARSPAQLINEASTRIAAIEDHLHIISDYCRLLRRATENDGELFDLHRLAEAIQLQQVRQRLGK